MPLYQIIVKATGVPVVNAGADLRFDDQQWALPGEPGYSDVAIKAFVTGTQAYNVIGRSPAAVNPAEAAELKRDIEMRSLAEVDPAEHQHQAAIKAVQDKYAGERKRAAALKLDANTMSALDALEIVELSKIPQPK
jgi:hypothetical protein